MKTKIILFNHQKQSLILQVLQAHLKQDKFYQNKFCQKILKAVKVKEKMKILQNRLI